MTVQYVASCSSTQTVFKKNLEVDEDQMIVYYLPNVRTEKRVYFIFSRVTVTKSILSTKAVTNKFPVSTCSGNCFLAYL